MLPLTQIPSGKEVTIKTVDGGCGARSKLLSLGIIPGTKVKITSNGFGPCRLKVRGYEVVIGRGLAEKILVSTNE